ncbi:MULTISPECIES: hypothetical protein [Streptomyces]|uniref:Uncharacterized protein n=1 Tax=Streptomyces evansiae TaxID=3075535 RepID=A0ABU2R7S4_9ACTN|nr:MULTISPECIES: hypothetical protein [unclassified Streptomyces]MDT0412742.1 hypothetical protein [Streptomyces sp. DSM 41979]MYQ56436.1 hypothetical protein [Streptomyces sp. SID4926]SCE48287.1 hypothetical protein GA0115252_152923 [Streptomyces sp. DfronAA-171]
MEAQSKAERRAINRRRHFEKRAAERGARGARGLAESWMEQARAVAAERERGGDPEAWNDLARTLSQWVDRYQQ